MFKIKGNTVVIFLKSFILTAFVLLAVQFAWSQDTKLRKCRADPPRGVFKIRHITSPDADPMFVYLIVSPKKQNDKNFTDTSLYFKKLYCNHSRIYVSFFDSERHFQLGMVPQPEKTIEDYSRALYFLDRPTNNEKLDVIKIVDGKLTTRYIDIPK